MKFFSEYLVMLFRSFFIFPFSKSHLTTFLRKATLILFSAIFLGRVRHWLSNRKNRMKKLLTTCSLMLLFCGIAHAADIRIVNNVRVDLSPVREWESSHQHGPNGSTNAVDQRPMPHWKKIEIVSCYASAPWPVAVISIDGKNGEVYLKNLPIDVLNAFTEDGRLLKAIADKGQWISGETKRLREVGAHESEWEYGSPNWIRFQQDSANLDNQKDNLKELQEQWKSNYQTLKTVKEDFAMFTGQVYANRQVWDMGQKTQ